ncbi:MAG: CRISPR-associated CARF protein Csx1 [Thermoplasmatales archaeon]
MKVLIAAWGQPAYWKKVRYNFESEDLTLRDVESCTTLKILSEHYDNTILVVSESIFDFTADPQKPNNDCANCMNQVHWDVPIDGYKKMIDAIESNMRKVLDCIKIKGNIHIVVMPAIGQPGPKMQFAGKMDNFTSIGLFKIYDLMRNFDDIEEIAVDVTHGINYMSSLILEISKFLAQVAFLKHAPDSNWKGIKMRVYNADPVSNSSDGGKAYSINKIIEEDVHSIEINSNKAEPPKDSIVMQHDTDLDPLKEGYSKIFNMVKSLYYPFPLALCLIYSKLGMTPSLLMKKAMNLWDSRTIIKGKIVEHNLTIYPLFAQHLILSDAVSIILDSMALNFDCIGISDIKNISKIIYNRVSVLSETLINQELSKIELNSRNKLPLIEQYLSELYPNSNMPNNSTRSIVNKRIMIAHAGFQYDLTKVKGTNKLCLNYDREVENILSKVYI